MTESVFFHCLSPVFSLMVELIFAVICLLILPISGLLGLMSLHFVFCWKLALWSLTVMNVSLFVINLFSIFDDDIYSVVISLLNSKNAVRIQQFTDGTTIVLRIQERIK